MRRTSPEFDDLFDPNEFDEGTIVTKKKQTKKSEPMPDVQTRGFYDIREFQGYPMPNL